LSKQVKSIAYEISEVVLNLFLFFWEDLTEREA